MKCVIFFVLFLLLIISGVAHEVRIGLLVHDVAPLWGNTKVEGGFDLNAEFIFGKGVVRPNMGMSINSQGETSKVYAGALAVIPVCSVSCAFGFGVVAQVNATRSLGSPVLFRLSLEIGYKDFSIMLDHISNANLAVVNAGLDTLGIRYRIRF